MQLIKVSSFTLLAQSSRGAVCAVQAYPLVHAIQEGSKFALQLGYLVERTAYYSPALWLLRQRIVRVSGGELVRCSYCRTLHLNVN